MNVTKTDEDGNLVIAAENKEMEIKHFEGSALIGVRSLRPQSYASILITTTKEAQAIIDCMQKWIKDQTNE